MSFVKLSHPTKIVKATIELPLSKSISNRVLILQSLFQKINDVKYSDADDTLIMQKALKQKSGILYLKNAGTCMRFLAAYFASANCEVELHGEERMQQRPIKILVDALKNLGADVSYLKEEGFPPIKIKGKQLEGGKIIMDASVSSQYISALMLVAPTFTNGLEIELIGEINSKSYIEMTKNLMQDLGFDCSFIQNKIKIHHQPINYSTNQTPSYMIEPDWSSASYWYEIVALCNDAKILLKNLSIKSLQGDSVISEHMKNFGVETIETDEGILLKNINYKGVKTQSNHSSNHQIIKLINLINSPDLAPTLAVTASAKNIELNLTGLKNLKIKESNRLFSIQNELNKCGFNIEINDDSLKINSTANSRLQTSNLKFQTHNDHRIAMSFAALALLFDKIEIENPEVVEKSYPHFWDDLKLAGFVLQFNN